MNSGRFQWRATMQPTTVVIGAEFLVLIGQIDPAAGPCQGASLQVVEPLHQEGTPQSWKMPARKRLVRKDVAHGNALVGDQHGQLRHRLGTGPECLVGARILLDDRDVRQGNGLNGD